MKISGVELTAVEEHGQTAELLVLRSDSDLCGVGEIAAPSGPYTVERSVVGLADLLVGRDPFAVQALVAEAESGVDGTIADAALVAAATSAMLDLAGRSLDVPVHQLLGGRLRDEVRACAVGWGDASAGTAELVAAATRTVAEGFTVLRIEPFGGALTPPATDVPAAVEHVRAVREALPEEVDLAIAGDRRLTPAEAMAFGAALQPLEPIWLEEPVAPWPVDGLRRVSDRASVPLTAGRGARPDVLRELVTRELIDHLVIEVGRVGGLVQARRIAALAEVFHIGIVPIGSGGAVSLHAAVQLAAVLPNLSMVEVRPGLASVDGGVVSLEASQVVT
jgi:galactonate dehydratase